jgi:cell division protein ZapA
VGVAAPAPVSSPEVDTLIKRLDEALGNDGQLL